MKKTREELRAIAIEQQSRIMKTPTNDIIMSYFNSIEIQVILDSLDEVISYHKKCVKIYDEHKERDPSMPIYIQEQIAARKKLKKLFTSAFCHDMRKCNTTQEYHDYMNS